MKGRRNRKQDPPAAGWPLGRFLLGAAALFVVGVGVGTGLGLWLGGVQDRPQTSLAVPEATGPAERRYDLPVTVYRSERALEGVVYEEAPPDDPDEGVAVAAAAPEPGRTEADKLEPLAPAGDAAGPVRDVPVGAGARPPVSDVLASPSTSGAGRDTRNSGPTATELARLEPDIPTDTRRPRGEPMWRLHAVPVARDAARPMIAVVIDDLGIDQPRTRRAVSLAGPLTLAFLPYGYNLRDHVRDGRTHGHEILVHLPMEPMNAEVDPGPQALLTSLEPEELDRRLDWALARFDGYVGVNNHMGSRFTAWPEGMRQLLTALNRRGLLFVDSITTRDTVGFKLARSIGMPNTTRDVFLDHDQRPEEIVRQLRRTEEVARLQGAVVAIGHPYDSTLAVLEEWLADIEERGFQLVPISAVVAEADPQG